MNIQKKKVSKKDKRFLKKVLIRTNILLKDVSKYSISFDKNINLSLYNKKGNELLIQEISSLERERLKATKLGKKKYIKDQLKKYKKSLKKMTKKDLIKDYLGYYPKYQDEKLLNQLFMAKNCKKARTIYYKKYKKDLKSKSFSQILSDI